MSRRAGLIRVVAFLVATVFLSTVVWRILDGHSFSDARPYRAVFTDVSGLAEHDDVRVAGVVLGRVDRIITDAQRHSVVEFHVDPAVVVTDQTRAVVRYKNLTGNRFLSLSEGIAPASAAATGSPTGSGAARTATAAAGTPAARPLGEDGTIPVERTEPALDLDALFGGFQPLFEALTPDQVNRLSRDLISVLQGEGGTITTLLRDVADFSTTIADRDAVIGQVIANLSLVLGSVTEHGKDFSSALDQAQRLVSGLAQDRRTIAAGLSATSDLAGDLAVTLQQLRPELVATSAQVDRLATVLTQPDNAKTINKRIKAALEAYGNLAGSGSAGAFTAFHLCSLAVRYQTADPAGAVLGPLNTNERRCRF